MPVHSPCSPMCCAGATAERVVLSPKPSRCPTSPRLFPFPLLGGPEWSREPILPVRSGFDSMRRATSIGSGGKRTRGLVRGVEVSAAGAGGCEARAPPGRRVLKLAPPRPRDLVNLPRPSWEGGLGRHAQGGCVASAPARLTARPAPVSGPPRPLCTSPPLNTASILPRRIRQEYISFMRSRFMPRP
jgi:hypothetical protein